jgi:membrane protein
VALAFEVREAHRVPRRFRRYNEDSSKRQEFTTGCDAISWTPCYDGLEVTPLKLTRPRRRRTAASRWALGGLSLAGLGARVYQRSSQDEIFDRAAELSYYFAFALFPTLLFLTALLGLLPVPDLMPQLMRYTDRVLPGDAASLIKKTLAEVVRGASGGLVSIGVLTALFGASSGMLSIMKALNVAYGIADHRTWWGKRLIAIALTLVLSLFTWSALLVLVFGGRLGEAISELIGLGPLFMRIWHLFQLPLAVALTLTGLTLVYYLAPATERQWAWVTPGAAFAVVSWLVMSLGLKAYVAYFGAHNATYGSIGGLILLMLWLYCSGVTLLMGAEIDGTIDEAGAKQTRPEQHASPLATVPRDA